MNITTNFSICKSKFYNLKIPILITTIFFISTSYVAFIIDVPSEDDDYLWYYNAGTEILSGNGSNVALFNAPVGWPILLSSLDLIIHDAFITGKIYSIFGATGIVFFSYLITEQIFGRKIALLTQTLIAINPFLHSEAIITHSEMLPVFFIFIAFYFITKKQLFSHQIIFAAIFLGISFMLRYQSSLIFIGILIVLLLNFKKYPKHFPLLFTFLFFLTITPLLLYNFENTGNLLDADPGFYLGYNSEYKTPEMDSIAVARLTDTSTSESIESQILIKNYFTNLFLINPHNIFNLGLGWASFSPIPIIPYIGILFVLGGAIVTLNPRLNKKQLLTLLIIPATLLFSLYALNHLELFFLAIIVPILIIGIPSLKKLEINIQILLVVFCSFMFLISFVAIRVPWDLFSILIIPSTFTAIFLLKVIPKILSKISNNYNSSTSLNPISIILIFLIICSSLFFSFMFEKFSIYGEDMDYTNIIFSEEHLEKRSLKFTEIGHILSQEPNIQSKYVMSDSLNYSYYSNSKAKTIIVRFDEGNENDSINSYISRENWSPFEITFSNVFSYPPDRYNKINPSPDYLVYDKNDRDIKNLQILSDPKNPGIPSNFELIYISNKTGVTVYKIHSLEN